MRIEATQAPALTGAELAVITAIQAIVPADFFKPGGADDVLTRLETEVRERARQLDISTDPMRREIASLAYKVARSKTALDDAGKELGEDLLRQKQAIDAERRKVRDRLDTLKDEVRQPLTDWENTEKARVIGHENALRDLAAHSEMEGLRQVIDIELRIAALDELWNGRNWEEFQKRATDTRNATRFVLDGCLKDAERAEAERIEAERKAAEEREQAIREREERAAEAARLEAERKAAEQARLAREAAEAEQRRIENERIEAEARAKQAEAQRIAAEERAARELKEAEERRVKEAEYAEQKRIAAEKEAARQLELAEARRKTEAEAAEKREREAAEKAERDRAAAVEAERQRIAGEKRREAEEAEKRARNRAHQAAVNREILAALSSLNVPEESGKLIIAAIAKGAVPHLRIEY